MKSLFHDRYVVRDVTQLALPDAKYCMRSYQSWQSLIRSWNYAPCYSCSGHRGSLLRPSNTEHQWASACNGSMIRFVVDSFCHYLLATADCARNVLNAHAFAASCQKEKSQIGVASIETFLQMVLVDNFVHSDLHPGNILIQMPEEYGDEDDDGTDESLDLHATLFARRKPRARVV